MSESREVMEAAIEAVLFVAAEPVAAKELLALFGDDGELDEAAEALSAVLERYRDPGSGRGVILDEAGGGYRLVTRPELHSYLASFFESSSRPRLSMAALETLAIVAYRQPITAPEIAELRGVQSSSVLKTLLDHRLVRLAGRKEVVGRPFLYRTTREFLVRFGLNHLRDLPPLEELEELLQAESGAGELSFDDPEEQRALEAAAAEEADSEDEDEPTATAS